MKPETGNTDFAEPESDVNRHATLIKKVAFGAIVLAAIVFLMARPRENGQHRVVMANVNAANEHHEEFIDFIKNTAPDVFIVQELTEDWDASIRNALPNYYGHSAPQGGYFGIGVWTREPVQAEITYDVDVRIPTVSAEVFLGKTKARIVSTHVFPPTYKDSTRIRSQQFDALRRQVGPSTIIIGDFNTLPWQEELDGLGESAGLAGTWLNVLPLSLALITDLDLKPVAVWSGPSIGSDHRPFVLELDPP